MKKFLIAITACVLSAVCIFGIAGCGDKNSDKDDGGNKQEIKIVLSETSVVAEEDEIFTLVATVTPARSVRWSSRDDKIAAVSSSGRVIAKNAGKTVITAEAENAKATCEVTVTAAEKGDYYITADKAAYLTSVNAESNKKIEAKLFFSGEDGDDEADGEKLTFSSLDESIATVSEEGEIIPVSVGTTEIIISAKGVSAYVTADVYTAAITTPQEWLAMFKEDAKHSDRYYLENDIDFEGVTYDFGRDFPVFGAEVNGNYHTVKNVTSWRDKRYSDPTRDAFQGLFGADVFGARVKNIAFKNICFTKSDCAILADSVRMHPDNYHWGDPLYETKFSNVNIEAVYATEGSGLFKTVYGVNLENVFASLTKKDGTKFGSSFNCVVREDYLNWGLGTSVFERVVVYVEGGTAWEKNPSSVGITLKDSYVCETKQDALYRAFTTFDKNVWKLSEKEMPEFRGEI